MGHKKTQRACKGLHPTPPGEEEKEEEEEREPLYTAGCSTFTRPRDDEGGETRREERGRERGRRSEFMGALSLFRPCLACRRRRLLLQRIPCGISRDELWHFALYTLEVSRPARLYGAHRNFCLVYKRPGVLYKQRGERKLLEEHLRMGKLEERGSFRVFGY